MNLHAQTFRHSGYLHRAGRLVSFDQGTIQIVVIQLDVNEAIPCEDLACLSEDERRRAWQFRFARDRRRFIGARVRLRQLLATLLDTDPAQVLLRYGRHGKPELSGRFTESELQFSVSHADDLAVYAFTVGRPIGIDVEAIRPLADADAIARGLFSRHEKDAYFALHPNDRALGFFNCWTRKEAFVKAVGNGLSYPLQDFDVSLVPNDPAVILRVEGADARQCRWSIESFAPMPGYVAAVVTERAHA